MGLSYTGSSAYQRGNELAETGGNLDSFEVRYFPQFKDFLNNFQGQAFVFATTDKFSRDVTITGEQVTSSSTGVMLINLTTAFVPANDISDFVAIPSGTNAGGLYANEMTISQSRDGWRRFSIPLHSDPLIT